MEAEHVTDVAQRLRPHLQVDYDEARVAELERAARGRAEAAARAARVRRAALAAALVLACVGALAYLAWPRPQADPGGVGEVAVVASATPRRVALTDGTLAQADVEGAIEVTMATRSRVELELKSGSARFDVARDEGREFVVQAGEVRVTVLGTAFDVRRRPGEVEIEVLRGRVKVEASARGASHTLERGERVVVASSLTVDQTREQAQVLARRLQEQAREAGESMTSERPRARSERSRWVTLAKRGDRAKAAKLLEGGAQVDDEVEELMLAADVMRAAGLHEESVRYLDGVVSRHRRDRRWTLAAFKKGRILLSSLDDPERAARTFAEVAEARDAALSEDALAREVEAWSKAGERAKAAARAADYMKRHPRGSRIDSVKRFGGPDDPTP